MDVSDVANINLAPFSEVLADGLIRPRTGVSLMKAYYLMKRYVPAGNIVLTPLEVDFGQVHELVDRQVYRCLAVRNNDTDGIIDALVLIRVWNDFDR